MKIYNSKNVMGLKELPVLDNGTYYIYVMLNSPQENIKIGITTNILQRLQSLSGSNSGGNKIVKLAVSEPTYVASAEKAFHNHYDRYRIPNTEWFDGNKLNFEDVVNFIDKQFQMKSYETCNKLRKELYEKEQEKIKQEEKEREKEEQSQDSQSKQEKKTKKKSSKTKIKE